MEFIQNFSTQSFFLYNITNRLFTKVSMSFGKIVFLKKKGIEG